MRFWGYFKTFLKKIRFFLFLLPVIVSFVWLEFKVFDFSFLSLSQKNVLLFLLFQLNLIFILVLLYFIFRYLFKIFWEIKVKKISKSIKIKFFATYFLSIIFPSIILVLGSFFFFKKTLDYWLKEFFREKFIAQLVKAEDYYKEIEQELLIKGQNIIKKYISRTTKIRSKVLRERYRYFSGLDSIEVYTYSGELYKKTYSSKIDHKLGIPPSILEKLRTEKIPVTQVSTINSGILIRVFIPCKDKKGREFILATGKVFHIELISGKSSFPEKKYFKIFKKFLMLAGFSVLLLVIFIGIWVGSKIGKNLTEPLHNLVLATQKISQKDFQIEDLPLTGISEDELGLLIKSFKDMAKKLKEYEEELKRYNEYLISILNHLPIGVLILNMQYEVKYLNQSLKELFKTYGFKNPEEFLEFLEISSILKSVDLEEPFYKTFDFTKNEKEIILGITIIKLKFFKEPEFMLIVENLEEKEKLKRLSLWKEVALRIAHEIKNPLTPIKLSVERLRRQLERSLEGREKEVLLKTTGTIEKYVEELRKLATDFYYFSRKPALNLEKGSLLESLLEVIDLYEFAYPKVKFDIKAEDEAECLFDKFQFKRVWINLIDNCIKAMNEEGEIEIFLVREGRSVIIEIADNGEGIPEDIQEKIEKGELIKLKEIGTGLLMVYSIIQLHHGTFKIEKNKPRGTRFIIVLPC